MMFMAAQCTISALSRIIGLMVHLYDAAAILTTAKTNSK